MIRIQRSDEVEDAFFNGRDFSNGIDTVHAVLKDVQARKDAALHEYSTKFDMASPATFEIPLTELKAAADRMQKTQPALYKALSYSHALALEFALKQKESFDNFEIELEEGLFTGQKNIAVERAGVYVPAGRFPLVSTVVMTVTPAAAAGVKDIILCTPPRVHPADRAAASKAGTGVPGAPFVGGKPYADENIMAAAYICGVTKVFACGGSQAIAALAFGTESIPRTDVIVGPGNKYVAEAKRLVYGTVGIDMIAGPTEVFIIADKSAKPEWLAADLLAQAEHDVLAQPVLATPDTILAEKVAVEIEKQLAGLPTRAVAEQSITNHGRIIITKNLVEAAELANRKAPEHLELAMDAGPERNKMENLVHNYGSLFIGHNAAEVLGDYAAGLNHTLPTSGSARFTGGLSVRAFLKTVTTLRVMSGSSGAMASAEAAGYLGDAEGLSGHAYAARLRLTARDTEDSEEPTGIQKYLDENITSAMSLGEMVDAFKAMCDISVKSPMDKKMFETGVSTLTGDSLFYFRLVRLFKNGSNKDIDKRLCLDIHYEPDDINKNFKTTLKDDQTGEGFFTAVKKSTAFLALQNAKILDYQIYIDEA